MSKQVARVVFFIALLAFVVYVEWGWILAKGKALSSGVSEYEFELMEVSTLSAWEIPLLVIFALAPIGAIVWLVYRRMNTRNTRTAKTDLSG